MRYGQLSVLCILTAVSIHGLQCPSHHIGTIYVSSKPGIMFQRTGKPFGPPSAGTTINFNFLFMPHDENALIDALYNQCQRPNARPLQTLPRTMYLCVPCSVTDMETPLKGAAGHSACQPSRSSSYTPGLETVTYRPPPSQRPTAAAVARANELLGASY